MNIDNKEKGEWFFNLMFEIEGMKNFNVEEDDIKEFLFDFIKTKLNKPKRYGCNLLKHYYSEFLNALNNKNNDNTMYWFNSSGDLYTTYTNSKRSGHLTFIKDVYKDFNHLGKYFDLCIDEPIQQNEKKFKLPIRTDFYKTVLNQKQTSLLAYFLRKNKLILPNTSYELLADCFGKMTGYSNKQIKKDYGGLKDIIDITDKKNDYNTLIEVLNKLISDIETYKQENEKNKNLK